MSDRTSHDFAGKITLASVLVGFIANCLIVEFTLTSDDRSGVKLVHDKYIKMATNKESLGCNYRGRTCISSPLGSCMIIHSVYNNSYS